MNNYLLFLGLLLSWIPVVKHTLAIFALSCNLCIKLVLFNLSELWEGDNASKSALMKERA